MFSLRFVDKRRLPSLAFHVLIIPGVFLASDPGLLAQVLYGSISGNVSDSSGALIPGATVVVTSLAEHSSRTTNSNESGGYDVSNLKSDDYTVTVTMSGFRDFRATNVQVSVGIVARVDVHLQIGMASQSITVDASVQALQTDQADIHDEIDQKSLEDLPSPIGRNYQASLRTLPGYDVTGGGAVRGANPAASLQVKVNGVPAELNNFRIDGASAINNFVQSNTAYVPGLDAIQSVQAVSNSSGADTGLAGGASVNVQIKSGTNQIYGSAFEYHTDNALRLVLLFSPLGNACHA
jgi:hypothetical protein